MQISHVTETSTAKEKQTLLKDLRRAYQQSSPAIQALIKGWLFYVAESAEKSETQAAGV